MNEILTISYDAESPTVSARELHDKLEISERFSNWFNRQLQYGFEEDTDFRGCKVFNALANQELQDYKVSVDMAKQICMLQRSEKGKLYRQYFIDLEKAWNTPEQIFARALKIAEKEIDKLKQDNTKLLIKSEEDKPKVIFAEAVSTSKTSILVGDLAKIIKQNGVNTGAQRLFTWMRDNEYLIKRKGTDWNMPTQKSMNLELFEIKESTHIDGNGCNITTKTPKVTGKGQQYFINKFLEER